MRYDINTILRANPVNAQYGAPLGQRSFAEDLSQPLLLQRVEMQDSDYAADGTYWGSGEPLWCAFNPPSERFAAAMGTRIYVRAATPEGAVEQILEQAPQARIEPESWVDSEIVHGYLEAARFSECETAEAAEIDAGFVQQAREECARFLLLLRATGFDLQDVQPHQVGIDLWLTRNGHGSGFWDRPEIYGQERAQALTEVAKLMGPHEVLWAQDAESKPAQADV
ncbi:MAG: hypothetical protein N2690_05005 [Rhodocyclaceae bacterium]|nr:hypothetical protein [Rhodocyclaceae bacterium]